jgi:hypothetical protein
MIRRSSGDGGGGGNDGSRRGTGERHLSVEDEIPVGPTVTLSIHYAPHREFNIE